MCEQTLRGAAYYLDIGGRVDGFSGVQVSDRNDCPHSSPQSTPSQHSTQSPINNRQTVLKNIDVVTM